jgi:hypothetical protein
LETKWYSPRIVHQVEDTTNTITTPDPTILSELTTLTNELVTDYNAHRIDTEFHIYMDFVNPVNVGELPEDLPTIADALLVIGNAYNEHIASYPDAHGKWDNQNEATVPDTAPTILADAITLAVEIKDKFNAHLVEVTYGLHTGDAIFELTDATREQATFYPDLATETFEKDWAIPDIYTLEEQVVVVTVDDPTVSWPVNHIQFSDVFEYIGSELGIAENFENGWNLPGTGTYPTNDVAYARYFDKDSDAWAFRYVDLDYALVETFEAGWLDNDVGYDMYWSGSEWEFDVYSHLARAGMDSVTIAEIVLPYGHTSLTSFTLPEASPYFYAEVSSEVNTTVDLGIEMAVKNTLDSISQFTCWFTEGAVGTISYDLSPGLGGAPTDERFKSYVSLPYFVKEITYASLTYGSSTGQVDFKGWTKTYEDFSGDWTQVLED